MPTVELTNEQLGTILISLDIRATTIKMYPYEPMHDVTLASVKDAKSALLSHNQPEAPYLGD